MEDKPDAISCLRRIQRENVEAKIKVNTFHVATVLGNAILNSSEDMVEQHEIFFETTSIIETKTKLDRIAEKCATFFLQKNQWRLLPCLLGHPRLEITCTHMKNIELVLAFVLEQSSCIRMVILRAPIFG